jgi:hypothetical protein
VTGMLDAALQVWWWRADALSPPTHNHPTCTPPSACVTPTKLPVANNTKHEHQLSLVVVVT